MKIGDLTRSRFIKEWTRSNLLGWLLGILLGPFLFYLVITPVLWSLLDINYDLYESLQPIIVAFPLGLSVGIVQQRKLQRWNIISPAWALVTAMSLGVPTTLITWLFQSDVLGYSVPMIALIAGLIIISISVGGLQAYLLRKSISKPILWIVAYVLGSLLVGVVEFILMAVAFLAAEPIEKFLYSVGLWQVVEYRDPLLLFFVMLVFPFLAAFFIGLPTGVIFFKFGSKNFSNENRDTELTQKKLIVE